MKLLTIDFQDGFSNDTVIVRVDNQEVFHKQGVTTDLAVGRADSVETQVREGSVNVEITVPSQSLSETIVLQVAATVYLGVSILNNKLNYQISTTRFLYF